MKVAYNVRFARSSKYQLLGNTTDAFTASNSAFSSSFSHSSSSPSSNACQNKARKSRRTKSRNGCQECRQRRVKCDETYPVCLRCQKRGSICLASAKPIKWHTEMPWLSDLVILDSWTGDIVPNKRLVQFWVEQTSQMMSLDRNNNPLALPLLQHLTASPSLLHAIQSVSAGHETFFRGSNLKTCLEERGRALTLVRRELNDHARLSIPSMLTVFLLGVSSPWTETRPDAYGKEHLDGARAMMKIILSDEKLRADPLTQFLLGWYLYWDMTCAFLDDPNDCSSLDMEDVSAAFQEGSCSFHPMIGFCSELYVLVSTIGRYCRRVLSDSWARNPDDMEKWEAQLLAWEPTHENNYLTDLSFAYRNHGLLMLYRSCEDFNDLTRIVVDRTEGTADLVYGTEAITRSYALQSIRTMLDTPMVEPCVNFQSLPLLSAGAELTSEDALLREEVVSRFRALYSISRVMVNMWSIELLEELWDLRDCGIPVSWMELILVKGWRLCFS